MADELNSESQMEAELQSLFTGTPQATEGEPAVDPKVEPGAKPGTVPPPTAPATEPTDGDDASDASDAELTDLEKKLKALDELDKPAEGEPKPEDKPQTPALTEDQQVILSNIPDRQTAETLVHIANSHVAFEEAFVNGDFEQIEGMFTNWNKEAYENFQEQLYQKFVAKDGQWVKRFIQEREALANGDDITYKQTQALEKKVAALENQLKGRAQQQSNEDRQRAERQVFDNYTNELNSLFTKVGIADEADKKFIMSAINAEVKTNPKVVQEIRQGNYKGLTQIFKTNANAYLKRDQAFTTKTETKIKEQTQKKVPLGGGGGPTQTTQEADHDFKSVKRGDEDTALDSKLGNFFSRLRGKK